MQISILGYLFIVFVIVLFLVTLVIAIIAWKRRILFIFDAGTVILAPVACYLVGFLKPEFRRGWELIFLPIATLLLGCLLFVFRILVLDRLVRYPRYNSIVLCILLALSAVAGMLLMHPIWD